MRGVYLKVVYLACGPQAEDACGSGGMKCSLMKQNLFAGWQAGFVFVLIKIEVLYNNFGVEYYEQTG